MVMFKRFMFTHDIIWFGVVIDLIKPSRTLQMTLHTVLSYDNIDLKIKRFLSDFNRLIHFDSHHCDLAYY